MYGHFGDFCHQVQDTEIVPGLRFKIVETY
jgi:hypothetical protein